MKKYTKTFKIPGNNAFSDSPKKIFSNVFDNDLPRLYAIEVSTIKVYTEATTFSGDDKCFSNLDIGGTINLLDEYYRYDSNSSVEYETELNYSLKYNSLFFTLYKRYRGSGQRNEYSTTKESNFTITFYYFE